MRSVSSASSVGPGVRLGVDGALAPLPGGVGAYDVEEAPPRDGDQPALRVARRAGLTERAHGLDQRLLDGVLGRREVGSATDEDADDGRHQLAQRQLVEGIHAEVEAQSCVADGAP